MFIRHIFVPTQTQFQTTSSRGDRFLGVTVGVTQMPVPMATVHFRCSICFVTIS